MDSFDKIRKYYDQFDEWNRLESPSGILEKMAVLKEVTDFVPAGAHILDLGSGPGRYAIALARMGYRLSLVDLSGRLIEQAREKFAEAQLLDKVGGIEVGNAMDMSGWKDESYDAIFCCGPFYHLVIEKDRLSAAREVMRLCKPGGQVIIGWVPRFSGLAGLIYRAARRNGQVSRESFAEVAESGVFQNSAEEGFQEGYYPTLEEFRSFWKAMGLADIEVASTRSFMHQQEGLVLEIKEQNPQLFMQILETSQKYARREGFIEAGGHALLLGKKRA